MGRKKKAASESRSGVPQDSGNCGYRVPITCCYRDTENLVELAKVAKRFHLAPLQPENEPVFRGKALQKPFAARRKTEGCRRQRLPPFRQNTHKPNDLWVCFRAFLEEAKRKARKLKVLAVPRN